MFNDNANNINLNCITEQVEFFDSKMKKFESVFNVKKHIFYKNIYAFIDELKNVIVVKKTKIVRLTISQCLRQFALI